jgi:putative FmdB family regulatory protein
MPIYEYKCKQCDTKVTRNKSVTQLDDVESCETCGNELKRVYSSIGVTFSGSGFYSTDK